LLSLYVESWCSSINSILNCSRLFEQNLIPSWPWSFQHTSCISGAKQNTQTKNFVGHPDRHTWQYCRSLWFSTRSVWLSDEFQKVCYSSVYYLLMNIMILHTETTFAPEMQLVCWNDHGQLGIRFCFKWHLKIYFLNMQLFPW
jgi:hypothetical protein